MQSSVLTRLGDIGIHEFLRQYWQRRPLLVRRAFPNFRAPVKRARLFALARHDDVESRLVTRRRNQWTLRHGPFNAGELPSPEQRAWTLLVQGLDLVDAGADALLGRFRFVPDARLDDLMASYATDGGGVGPHVDNYDVFLLQAEGRRRWRISRQHGLHLRPGQPLKLLTGFRPTQEWVLEPGDLLYLPPGVAHDGVAEGPCITYSIGFRAPTWQELLDPWLASFAERARLSGRYSDPGQRPVKHPGRLPPAMVRRAHAALSRSRPKRADTERFLLEHLSEPKAEVVFRPSGRSSTRSVFARAAAGRGIVLDRCSRLLVGRAGVGLNGEFFAAEAGWMPKLQQLADQRALEPRALEKVDPELMTLLHEWSRVAWLHVAAGRAGPSRASGR